MRARNPWTSREVIFRKWAVVTDHVMNSGNRNKLWSETAWTFIISDGAGPSFGFGDCCDVWCMHLKRKIPHLFVAKWTHELKVRYETLITLNLKEFVLLALVSIFIIHYRRIMKIIPFINTLSQRKLYFRLGYRNLEVVPLNSWSQLDTKISHKDNLKRF